MQSSLSKSTVSALPLPSPSSSSISLASPLQRGAALPSSSARNPISLRLYKVLGTNFQDPTTREALETLSSFYAPEIATPGQTEVGDEDEDEGSDEEDGDEGSDAQPIPMPRNEKIDGDIAEKARKLFRKNVEGRLLEGSYKFLQAFKEVDEQKLDVLQVHVKDMQGRCDEAQVKLQATNEGCKYLLERAGSLQMQRQNTIARQSIISAFLSRFTLTEAETEALTSRDVPVGRRVFDAMDKTARIREDCQVLLSGDGGDDQAGLDIMSMTAERLEQGYQKLFRWCSFEFRQLARDAHLDVAPVMSEAVRRLRQRPDLLAEALKILSSVRQATLLSLFLEALTRGGPGGLPRPIELHAHDPMRYVGDMLAWVHQAMAGEREFLDGLFGVKDGRMVGSIREYKGGEVQEYIRALMDEDLEKLCMPLKVRVQQTIKSQEGSITSYKIANLLQFYKVTVQGTVGADAILSQTLQEATEIAYQVFFDTIEAQGRSLLRFLHPPEADLSPPLALRDTSQVLRDIMSVYDSSLLEAPAQDQMQAQILDAIVDPALEMCKRMFAMRRDGTKWDRAVFLINCTVFLQTVLQPYEFTKTHVASLEEEVNESVQILVDEHYALLLQESGLAPIIESINTKPADRPLSHIASADSSSVTSALSNFDAFLSTLDVISSPRLTLLSVPRLVTKVHRAALARIGRAYGTVCEAVKKAENRYEFASTLLGSRRPFGQMSVLWQVLGVDEGGIDGVADSVSV
ncbi:hypothetical protein BOTBODRAFT_111408 [Botryobasidium botryosum FD-172 SS1]|uniref:Conserved oligomeric Golgi complex subunit 6 n=1 Tax=Botryobasidium botryosum (strain FD-172 SS1) TaxID=930990 RepID=A0A067MD51_BOTB1|nr:hypothetical protein BOTBODRAFT_111408 [Botryobasidium botryosum FD-172 SS1]